MARGLDPAIARLRAIIDRDGLAIMSVGYGPCDVPGCTEPPNPFPWTYTIGLWRSGLPELVVMGLSIELASEAILTVVDERDDGADLEEGDELAAGDLRLRLSWVPAQWVAADPDRIGRWFAVERRFSEPPMFEQVVVADPDGRFPDDADHSSSFHATQPLLCVDPFSYPPRPNREQRRRRPPRAA
jgi:hypothetical protein